MGIVSTPVPTSLATGTPDIVPNKLEAKTAACAGPPLVFLVIANAKRINDAPTPVDSRTAPKIINGKTVKITISNIWPMTPLLRLYHISSGKLSTNSIELILKIQGKFCPVK